MSEKLVQYEKDYKEFQRELTALEGEAVSLSGVAFQGALIRQEYMNEIRAMSKEWLAAVEAGYIKPYDAAVKAFDARNKIRALKQANMTNMGKAIVALIEKHPTFQELWYRRMAQVADEYRKLGKVFDAANPEHLDDVSMAMIKGAGKNRGWINPKSLTAGGVTFAVISLLFIGLDIYTAQDKSFSITKNITSVATGAVGFWAGAKVGALAGTTVGPIGTVVGGLIGGIVFSLVGEEIHARVRGMGHPDLDRLVNQATGWIDFDEDMLGKLIAETFGPDMNRTGAMFAALREKRSADSDDVVYAYVEFIRPHITQFPNGILKTALHNRPEVVQVMFDCLDEGWTSGAEYSAMNFLKGLL